jgi:hypothetical protein
MGPSPPPAPWSIPARGGSPVVPWIVQGGPYQQGRRELLIVRSQALAPGVHPRPDFQREDGFREDSLFDVLGRRVRDLGTATTEPGLSTFRWDGRDEAVRALPGGLY